jgi:hypothetical protein
MLPPLAVAQVPLPARKVVALGVPVIPPRLAVPMPVRPEPEPEKAPEKVVAVAVPLIFKAPLNVVVPMATWPVQVELAPPIVPVSVGEDDSTTLPVPVGAVEHEIAVPLVAVQKSGLVSVPKLTAELLPIAIQLVPLQ